MIGPTPSNAPHHVPVLPVEVLQYLAPTQGQIIIDATVGAGGHTRLIVDRIGPSGRLVGLDQDATMLALARERLLDSGIVNVELVHRNFGELRQVLDELKIEEVDGVIADLGICSDQLDASERGFSFQQDGPLDMRLNQTQGELASSLLRRLNERDLAALFWKYGEERFQPPYCATNRGITSPRAVHDNESIG